jgi:hypothetical protein
MKSKTKALTILLSVCSSLMFPLAVPAQSDNWTSVKATPKGTEIFVERKRDDRVIGTIHAVTDDSIVITSDEGSFIIGKDNVAKIYLAVARDKKKSMNRGALYGMLGGLASGIALATLHPPENEEMPWVGTFFAGIGIGTLAGIRHGKGKDKGPMIYSAR